MKQDVFNQSQTQRKIKTTDEKLLLKKRTVLVNWVEYLELKKINKPEQIAEINDALVWQSLILNDAKSSNSEKQKADKN